MLKQRSTMQHLCGAATVKRNAGLKVLHACAELALSATDRDGNRCVHTTGGSSLPVITV